MTELIRLFFDKIMQTDSYTVIVLGSTLPDKRFAIYTDPNIGKTLQLFLTESETPRPLTHEIITKVFGYLNIKIKQVVITDVQDTIYFARLFLEQDQEGIKKIIEIDSRPSDCLILALMNNVPVFCTENVLDKIIPVED